MSRGVRRAAADAEPLWRRVQLNVLTLSAEAVPHLAAFLAARAPAIRCLVLHGRALPTVAAVLAQHVDALAAAVQGMSRLEQLDLPRALATQLLARLDPQRLPHLRAVGADLAPTAHTAAGGAPSAGSGGGGGGGYQSRRRRSGEGGSRPLTELERATANLLALPALAELRIQSAIEVGAVSPPCMHPASDRPAVGARHRPPVATCIRHGVPSCPPACPIPSPLQPQVLAGHRTLQRLHFADARDLARGPLLAPLASLSRLASLRLYQRDGLPLPGPLTALAPSLRRLHAAVRYADDPLVVSSQLSALSSLQALWLQHASWEDGGAGAATLPALETLGLVGCGAAYAGVLEGLAAAPAPLPLHALHLEAHASSVAEVPDGTWEALARLASCPHLTRLELPFNRLRELPQGPCLAGVQVSCRQRRWVARFAIA